MIRYPIPRDALEPAIEVHKPGWLKRARQRTQKFVAAGAYSERAGIWDEVKPVYMSCQHEKCAYCERKLASADYSGTIEHDLEHYRPKNTVPPWLTADIETSRDLAYSFATGTSLTNGYYWLAYRPWNYCVACKKCNTPLKLNYFPVAAGRGAAQAEPEALNPLERPFLIYPMGDWDEDPEGLITFLGINAIPRLRNGPRWRRARVTIDFFELNRRGELRRERAEQLVALDNALRHLETGDNQARADARQDIAQLCHPSSRHTSCVRAACRLYAENTPKARALFQAARAYLKSQLAPAAGGAP